VTEVWRTPLQLKDRLRPGLPLAGITDVSTRPMIFGLLRRIMDHGAALDWELDIAFASTVIPLFFSGCNSDNGILVIGSAKARSTAELFEELVRMAGEKIDGNRNGLGKSSEISPLKTSYAASPDKQLVQLHNELSRVRQELVQRNLDLEKQKIENYRDLGMAVHGLRNPASGILLATEYLIGCVAGAFAQEHLTLLRGVLQSSLVILQMIDDVLEISTIECGRLKIRLAATDLVFLAKQSVLVNQRQAEGKGIRVDMISDVATLNINLDPVKITQVIDNLLSNAIKFSPRGGRVEIRIGVTETVASISIRDEGPGIPENQTETIFDAFRSGLDEQPSEKSGAGLGLAISRRIVEGHAGTIEVKSRPGIGSTFKVNLPMSCGSLRKACARAGLSPSTFAKGA
jgi:signal transduction histidine kinase